MSDEAEVIAEVPDGMKLGAYEEMVEPVEEELPGKLSSSAGPLKAGKLGSSDEAEAENLDKPVESALDAIGNCEATASDADSGSTDDNVQIVADVTQTGNMETPDISLDTSSYLGGRYDESRENSHISPHPESQNAKAAKKKDLKRKCAPADPDTESVSEDDLPEDGKMDTEAISDDELRTGGISGAETVSDDDFPPAQKRSKASKNKSKPEKKKAFDFKMIDWDAILDRVRESKSLPELEKYWKVVKEDPSDFTGWTYLLQYVDQENDVLAARDAYNSFLKMYPYCYGYWRKYADYEKRNGDIAECEAVFRKGLKAIPMSVDLWAHYLTHCKTTMKDDEELLRQQFEQAIEKCGLEFRSDKLWALYIQWENENRRYQKVLSVYDRLLETPIQNLKAHFEDLQHLINRHRPSKILSVDEFFAVRSFVVSKLKSKNIVIDTSSNPPGEGEDAGSSCSDEETVFMRERVLALRYKVYKCTMSKIADLWQYEMSIKRPYFHVKPLEKSQLENWTKYLDYEISAGDIKRTVALFERAMIACAMYQKFWLKYIRYLEQCCCDPNLIRIVYKRACLVHLPKNAHLLLNWAWFEEQQGNLNLARRIHIHAAEISTNLLLVQLRHIHFERRCGNVAKVQELFECYIAHSTQKCVILALVAKYVQFCQRCLNDTEKAAGILKDMLHKYPEEPKLYYLLLDLVRSNSSGYDEKCIDVFSSALESKVSVETKLQFAQMKLEYCHDFGTDPADMISAQKEYLNMHQAYREFQAEKYKNEYKTEGMYYYSKRFV